MKKTLLVMAITSSLFSSFTAAAEPTTFFTTLDAEVYTESQPVKSFIDDFDAPLKSGDSAFTFNIFELGIKTRNYTVGVQSRFDYLLEFDPDTARYLHTEKNDLPFEERDYRYFLDGKQATTNGVFVAYDFKFLDNNALTITPKFTIFSSAHFQDAKVDGTVFSDEIQGALEVDYYYSKDLLFKRFTSDENPTGLGYSFDLNINWQITPELELNVQAQDLAYETEYKEAGFVQGYTTEVPFTESESGSIITEPTIRLTTSANGHEVDHTFEMPVRLKASLNYRINNAFSAHLMAKQIKSDTFTQVTGRYHFADTWKLLGGYESNSQAFLVGIENEYIGLTLQTDSLDLDEAYYADLNWFVRVNF